MEVSAASNATVKKNDLKHASDGGGEEEPVFKDDEEKEQYRPPPTPSSTPHAPARNSRKTTAANQQVQEAPVFRNEFNLKQHEQQHGGMNKTTHKNKRTKNGVPPTAERLDHESDDSSSGRVSDEDEQALTNSSIHDDESLSSGKNNSNSGGVGGSTGSASPEEEFVRKETQQVFVLRIIVVVILLCAGAAVSVVVYLITTRAEDDEFEADYRSASRKIAETFLAIPTVNIGAVGGLVVANVAHGVDHFRKWPFVTLSSFQQRSFATRQLSLALQICVAPIVTEKDRLEWESFSNNNTLTEEWFSEGIEYQTARDIMKYDTRPTIPVDEDHGELQISDGVANYIYHFSFKDSDTANPSDPAEMYLPIYQTSPITMAGEVNQDLMANDPAALKCVQEAAVVFGELRQSPPGPPTSANPRTAEIANLLSINDEERNVEYQGDAYTKVFLPIFNDFSDDRIPVGTMRATIQWSRYFQHLLPQESKGVIVVLHNRGCDIPYTYQIDGVKVRLLGSGDLHDPRYSYLKDSVSFKDVDNIEDGTAAGMRLYHAECAYSLDIYPSATMQNSHKTNTPLIMTFSVAVVFLFTISMFFVYDRLVERRQRLILSKAERTNAIVSSLFPKTIRERLMEETDQNNMKKRGGGFAANQAPDIGKQHLKGGLLDPQLEAAPIADLFPNATVLFADIAGFTAWSSSREPAQVFTLLQAVYKEFDFIAKKRKVFKVETIGDSYVAVTGLPDPQPLHAVIMARFAQDCMEQMDVVVKQLEKSLGPDTGDLKMRFGMHSGPVTAGVLAGERSRFQLFGDTVNTAARMESTGVRSKIHCSQTTAELLEKAGKNHWVSPRENLVQAKGKGVLKTFWVNPRVNKASSESKSDNSNSNVGGGEIVESKPAKNLEAEKVQKHKRLIDWMTEMLYEHVKPIIAKRAATGAKQLSSGYQKMSQASANTNTELSPPIDELVPMIKLAPYDEKMVDAVLDLKNVVIPEDIKAAIREYVVMIATTYRDNPFHNFEHACHVTMSVVKFLKRVVTPSVTSEQLKKWKNGLADAREVHSQLHDYTHGINGDPLALFAIVYSAMIHDADHRGVSNVQLAKEEQRMADIFKNQSIAEQNSVAIAWKLFLSDQFSNLRTFLFPAYEELMRFRQVVVNVVLATDIFDKELSAQRKERWEKAFGGDKNQVLTQEQNHLRATIVIEHIIQASDVAHTMQHWHIYQKWNKRLFQELLLAYREGRMGADPATFWYKGEIGFFDNYVIPLAKKLEECNVFGVASDECLTYAVRNRDEWTARGEEQVAKMVEEFKIEHGDNDGEPNSKPAQDDQQARVEL